MSSEDRDADLLEQLRSFATTLALNTGEPIRPVSQRPNASLDVDGGSSIAPPHALTLAPTPRAGQRWFWAAPAAAATIVVVVGGLAALSNDVPPAEDRAPAQSVAPTPDTSAAPGPTGATEVADPESSVAPDATDTPFPTTGSSDTAAPPTDPIRANTWEGGLLADLEVEALLPLASVNDGDFVVPTAPADWRILSGGFGTHEAGFSNSAITIIQARPDGTTGPSIELDVSILGICVDRGVSNCDTSDESVEINGVVWQPFTERNGVRAKVGDLFIDVQFNDPDLNGPVLDDTLILEYLEGLRVGTRDGYWNTLRREVGQACWTCNDRETD